jgi:predicted HTH domain antitoxin
MMINAVIELSDDLYRILASHGLSKEVISRESKKLLALKCYKDKILSLGKSAELSELPKWDFIEFLSKNDVAVINYDEEQLDIEIKVVEKLGKASKI